MGKFLDDTIGHTPANLQGIEDKVGTGYFTPARFRHFIAQSQLCAKRLEAANAEIKILRAQLKEGK